MDLGLAGKIVVVTGASKGIGYACAEAFLREGISMPSVQPTPSDQTDSFPGLGTPPPAVT